MQFFKSLFKKKPKDRDVLLREQYERIGRIVAHGAMTDRNFNRAISRLPLYPKLLEIINQHPKQKKARLFVRMFNLVKKR